ncbi:hypothetical protein ACWD00_25465 [Streptomyces viridiviolaceus]
MSAPPHFSDGEQASHQMALPWSGHSTVGPCADGRLRMPRSRRPVGPSIHQATWKTATTRLPAEYVEATEGLASVGERMVLLDNDRCPVATTGVEVKPFIEVT